MKNKMQKQYEQEKMVAETIVTIRTQREDIERLAADFGEHAFEAAKLSQNEYADELLETQVELEDFADNLKYLELKVRTTAITAKTMGKLRELPTALNACKNIFCKGPDFKKLGKDMASLLDSLGTARNQFKELRMGLSKTKDPVYTEVFGERAMEDPKIRERIEAKKKALEARMFAYVNKSEAAPVPAAEAVSAEDAAKVDAIAAMIDEESKRG